MLGFSRRKHPAGPAAVLAAAAVVISGCAAIGTGPTTPHAPVGERSPLGQSSSYPSSYPSAGQPAPEPSTAQSRPATPPASPSSGPGTPPAASPADIPIQQADARPAAELPPPTSLSVAGTDIAVKVIEVGVTKKNAMQIPEDFHEAGWYKYGPAPGAEQGHAVIAGHVDSLTEVMPFAQLHEVETGTVVTVGRQDAPPLRYRVVDVRHVPKATLGQASVFARDGPHRLKIVTCGGDWLPEQQDYEDNVVLTAVPL